MTLSFTWKPNSESQKEPCIFFSSFMLNQAWSSIGSSILVSLDLSLLSTTSSPESVPLPYFRSSPSLDQTPKIVPNRSSCLQSFLSLPPIQSLSTPPLEWSFCNANLIRLLCCIKPFQSPPHLPHSSFCMTFLRPTYLPVLPTAWHFSFISHCFPTFTSDIPDISLNAKCKSFCLHYFLCLECPLPFICLINYSSFKTVLSNMVARSHTWLLSTWYVANLNFKMCSALTINNGFWRYNVEKKMLKS